MENLDVTLQRPIDGNFVTFYHRRVLDKSETKKSGRDKFTYRAYVRIKSPGQPKSVTDMEVSKNVLIKWEKFYPQPASFEYMKAWKDFNSLEHDQLDGSPLDEWNEITRSKAADLAQTGITTIENLAALPDAHCGIGQGKVATQDLRQKAIDFLAGDEDREVRADLAGKDAEIKALRTELNNAQSDFVSAMARMTQLEKNLELANNMSGRTGGNGDTSPVSDSGINRPNSRSGVRSGKKKSQRGRKAG